MSWGLVPIVIMFVIIAVGVIWIPCYMLWWFPHILRIQQIERDLEELRKEMRDVQSKEKRK